MATLSCTNPNINSVPDSVPPALPLLAPVIIVPAGQPIPPPPVIAATDNNPCFNTCVGSTARSLCTAKGWAWLNVAGCAQIYMGTGQT